MLSFLLLKNWFPSVNNSMTHKIYKCSHIIYYEYLDKPVVLWFLAPARLFAVSSPFSEFSFNC